MDDKDVLRLSVGVLALSAAGLVTIVADEGFSGRAIIPVVGDPPTYGFGSTTREDGTPVQLGDVITPHRAVRLAVKDIAGKETVLRKCIKVPLTQGEWDVYMNMAYNTGAARFCNSSFVTKLNAGDYVGACNEFLKWKYIPGPFDPVTKIRVKMDCSLPKNWGPKGCKGVWDRRQAQHRACLEAQP